MEVGKVVLRDEKCTYHVTECAEEKVAEDCWSRRVRSWLELGALRVRSCSVKGEAISVEHKDLFCTICH